MRRPFLDLGATDVSIKRCCKLKEMALAGFSGDPILSSHPIGIRGVAFEQRRVTAAQMSALADQPLRVELHMGPPQAIEYNADGEWHSSAVSPGSLTVTPAREAYALRWEGEREVLVFEIDLESCRQFLPEMLPRNDYRIRAVTNADDPQLYHLTKAFQAEAEAGCPAGRIYADSLAAAFVASFLGRYMEAPETALVTGLSPARLRQVTDYVQANLQGDLSVPKLASLVHTSEFHFSREFRRAMGVTPHQYVVERRIDKAQRLIEKSELSLAEVAWATGFPSQSHFTTVFRRHTGETPSAWRTARA
jgi:AraC family transcriptional regulator